MILIWIHYIGQDSTNDKTYALGSEDVGFNLTENNFCIQRKINVQ